MFNSKEIEKLEDDVCDMKDKASRQDHFICRQGERIAELEQRLKALLDYLKLDYEMTPEKFEMKESK
jgi:predicted transcriptional regulator